MSTELHLDTGAMALGALPADEAALVEGHLDSCESCAAELAGFRETVALLGSAAAHPPPASVRRAVLAAIAVTPQLPPLVAPAAAATTPPVAAPPVASTVLPMARWYRRPGALIAAAVAAVVLGAGGVIAVNQAGGPAEQVAQTPQQCVAQAADRQALTPEMGQGTVVYAPSCDAVTLDITGLPDLPDSQAYQLWAIAGQTPRSLGMLPEASAGEPQQVTATTSGGETVVAITTEPAAGSPTPTSDIIWQATLDA